MRTEEKIQQRPIRVGLIGFGKAGQAVCAELLKAHDIEVIWVMRRQTHTGPDAAESVIGEFSPGARTPLLGMGHTDIMWLLKERPVDFLVDFSGVESCHYYAEAAAAAGVGIVSAVSNYEAREVDVLHKASEDTCVLHSPNITVGINFVMLAAKILQRLAPHADVEIIEEHFRAKHEVSGTARRIAQALGLDEKEHINSVRVGGIVGRHEIVFGFPYQTLRLTHDSISRNAFGQGALFALRALSGRPAGFYTMEQLVGEGFATAVDA